ncbi:MAG: DUF2461 domain-containing protein [Bacteroidota bacterium]
MKKQTAIPTTTYNYLEDLIKNNNREWFNEHKGRYVDAKEDFKEFVSQLFNEMSKVDNVAEFKIFRIYRDVRFSKNKEPYKKCFSGYITRATKWLRGGYYFHIEPSNTFLAGGFWDPNSPDLKRIRQEIAADDKPLRKIIKAASFKKHFGEMEGDKVKTAPKGYAKDHPAIDLLRYKQYLLIRRFDDQEAMSPSFSKELVKSYKAMRPFFDYMSDVLTTDENGVPIE